VAVPHGSKAVVYMNGGDISSYLDDAQVSANVDSAETTTFGKTAKTYIPGLEDATLSLSGKYDGSAAAIDALISALIRQPDQQFLWLPGGDGFGNHAFAVQGALTKYDVHAPVSDVVSVAMDAQADGGADTSLVLIPQTVENAVNNGAAIDNLAGTTNGLNGYLHCKAITGTPACTVKIQHSTDNITFTDLITFASITTALTAQRLSVAGTVNRYLRAAVTAIGGASSVSIIVAAARQ